MRKKKKKKQYQGTQGYTEKRFTPRVDHLQIIYRSLDDLDLPGQIVTLFRISYDLARVAGRDLV